MVVILVNDGHFFLKRFIYFWVIVENIAGIINLVKRFWIKNLFLRDTRIDYEYKETHFQL